jgi:hypothetical protein
VEATWHITDKMTLTSWTGSIYEEQHQALDWDMTPYELVETYQNNKSALRSQEFQLSGSRGKIDWVGGYYYWNQTSDAHNPFWGCSRLRSARRRRRWRPVPRQSTSTRTASVTRNSCCTGRRRATPRSAKPTST